MRNQKTLELLYHSVYDVENTEELDNEEELYHHGVLGMSWGDRHGPPYPLTGVDKKVARAEAKRKREKERKLKKLQRAAKKARKEKKREEQKAADIQKKKQKLVKKGDMDAIKKNINLFTNEELQYIAEREAIKKGVTGKKERSDDEKMELAIKRMAQIADIGSSVAVLFNAGKAGADMVNSFKSVRVKELEADEKRMKRIKDEFDVRSKIDPEDARAFFEAQTEGKNYRKDKDSAVSKKERRADERERDARATERLDAYNEWNRGRKEEMKQQKAAERQKKSEERQAKREEKAQRKEQRRQQRQQQSPPQQQVQPHSAPQQRNQNQSVPVMGSISRRDQLLSNPRTQQLRTNLRQTNVNAQRSNWRGVQSTLVRNISNNASTNYGRSIMDSISLPPASSQSSRLQSIGSGGVTPSVSIRTSPMSVPVSSISDNSWNTSSRIRALGIL